MKAVVAAFNQEKALVGAFSVITNLRMELFQALEPGDLATSSCRSRTSSVGSTAGVRVSSWPRGQHGQGYLCPRLEAVTSPLATLWYDWFLPETSPDPLQVSQLEELFHQVRQNVEQTRNIKSVTKFSVKD